MIPASTSIAPAADAATSPPSQSTTPSAGTPTFDAILMLQNVAGTADGLEEPGLEDLELLGGDDDDQGEDPEALAFLADLLVVTRAGAGHDSGAGGGSQGGEDSPLGAAQKGAAEALLLAMAETAESDADAQLAAARAEATESGSSDAPQALSRAAEMLSTLARTGEVSGSSTLATHVRDPRWADELGARVSLMIRSRESSASLQLTPVDLGPLEVNVTVKDSQATIHFGATQADTRALLEASLPRLRELLAAQGFQLTDASVSSGFPRDRQPSAAPGASLMGEAETSTTEARPLRVLGLLDVYA